MNYWHTKAIAERHEEEIAEEMEQIRLEEEALAARRGRQERRSGWVDRRMFSLGNWMVATGQNLRSRYEMPDDCSDCPALSPSA